MSSMSLGIAVIKSDDRLVRFRQIGLVSEDGIALIEIDTSTISFVIPGVGVDMIGNGQRAFIERQRMSK